MASYAQQVGPGFFVPNTFIWDVIQNLEAKQDLKELLVILFQNINSMQIALNAKDTGYYPLEQFVTGKTYFPNPALSSSTAQQPTLRQITRMTLNIGALPAGVTSVAHGITMLAQFAVTDLYGAASDQVGFNYYPLPFASAGGATNIELRMNATNVIITNNSGINFTACTVVIELLKQ